MKPTAEPLGAHPKTPPPTSPRTVPLIVAGLRDDDDSGRAYRRRAIPTGRPTSTGER
jgi:hypothetical protein